MPLHWAVLFLSTTNFTALALNSVPSWKNTLSLKLKVQTKPSFDVEYEVASPGINLSVFESYQSKVSYMFDMGSNSSEKAVAGSQSLTSSYVAITKVLSSALSFGEQTKWNSLDLEKKSEMKVLYLAFFPKACFTIPDKHWVKQNYLLKIIFFV